MDNSLCGGLFCALQDFSSILGLYPQDNSITPPQPSNLSGRRPISLRGGWREEEHCSKLRTTGLGRIMLWISWNRNLHTCKIRSLTYNLTSVDTASLSGLKARIKIKCLPIPWDNQETHFSTSLSSTLTPFLLDN